MSWFAFATADLPLGVSTAFEHTAARTEKAVVPGIERTNGYFGTSLWLWIGGLARGASPP